MAARVFTIANNKGGCGKTTTAANVGAGLRQAGFDVLLIDADAQANLTACVGVVPPPGRTTYDALKAPQTPLIEPVRLDGNGDAGRGVLDVLPAVADLSAVEAGLVTEADRFARFRAIVDRYRPRYDCIIIDTPPAVGMLTISALCAADAVIITVQPQYLAVQGLLSLTRTINALNLDGATVEDTRVLFTQYDRRKGLHRLTVERVEAAGFQVYTARVRDNVALGEAPAAGVDIFTYAPRSNGAADYAALVAEIRTRHHLNHTRNKELTY